MNPKLKIGDRVKAVENHDYLGISKRHIGTVTDLNQYRPHCGQSVNVKFRSRPGSVTFQIGELKKARAK